MAYGMALAGSLFALCATLAMAVRSYWLYDYWYCAHTYYDTVQWNYSGKSHEGKARHTTSVSLSSYPGWIEVDWRRLSVTVATAEQAERKLIHESRLPYPMNRFKGDIDLPGFKFINEHPVRPLQAYGPSTMHRIVVQVHLGWLIFAFGLFPVAACIGWWRGRRERVLNPCSHCGYSLTGNTSGVCPECGTATTLDMTGCATVEFSK